MSLRVAFVSHSTNPIQLGGAEHSLLCLLDGLRGRISPLVIVANPGPLVAELKGREIPYRLLGYQNEVSRPLSFRGGAGGVVNVLRSLRSRVKHSVINRSYLPRLATLICEWKADVVYSNSSVITIGMRAASRLGLPHVWHIRELRSGNWGIAPDLGWGRWLELAGKSEACIAISKAVRQSTLAGIPDEKVHVIYNGVARESEFDHHLLQHQQRRAARRSTAFVSIGTLAAGKHQDDAVRALAACRARFPDATLNIVGGGDQAPFRRLCGDLGVADAVSFAGPTREPWSSLYEADVKLMCSEGEAMGRVTAEAMAAGVAVIGRDSGGTPELLEHGKTGLLFRTNEDLVKCMNWALEDRARVEQLAAQGWASAKERFATEHYAGAVEAVLHRVARARN